MKLLGTYEFDFLNGFTSYLKQALEALHRSNHATLELLRTDSAQMRMPDGKFSDVMIALQVSSGEENSVTWRAATVELTETDAASQYGIRLALFKGGDELLGEEKIYEGEFICRLSPPVKDQMWKPEHSVHDAGQVIATAVFEFMRDTRTPESHEFLQGALDLCEKE